jgi:outer membrane protein OmpA-like peptidoglycan-associated protein
MKKNKQMKIQIEGHINGGELSKSTESFKQLLSEQRTETIFNYLKNKGIDTSRMSKIGYADKYMLFLKPINDYENEANRRVEIKIVSIND